MSRMASKKYAVSLDQKVFMLIELLLVEMKISLWVDCSLQRFTCDIGLLRCFKPNVERCHGWLRVDELLQNTKRGDLKAITDVIAGQQFADKRVGK